ncbi:hypothetical protein SM0020_10965 [Sinorhizobium meliloti CCNWSX0020]|uniref:Uncharacterized protein n=1 Tax=Sinorhizobium meliloti CCNWSX0020 TaxID=1107881 RepID=H0FYB7_RHIML|nr:hypothetical protein [Sinorhizobium meliloti]EHK77971.1 hypothetical protein SM0020_10965 [Sinorhizobium meliloti CCNWSX0020]RVG73135.1 hypothetical protein CN220_08880 [Sinorhizobium meliloti]
MADNETAVKSRFPARVQAIDELLARNEDFRDMCADYALAEDELRKWRSSQAPDRDRRIDEYNELVEGLAAEIDAALDAAAVATFPRR